MLDEEMIDEMGFEASVPTSTGLLPAENAMAAWQVVGSNSPNGDTDDMSLSGSLLESEYSFSSIEIDEETDVTDEGLSKPFDMELLRSSIENGSHVLDHIAGKDVVLVVGKTGTGKSSLIQGIAGKSFSRALHTTTHSGQTVAKEVFEAEDALPGFEIGHDKSSKTSCINFFVRVGVGKKKEDIVYVDSPGFEDTDGQEIDIATSVMLSQVAKNCLSLRFVVVINYASLLEDRGGAIRNVLKLVRAFVLDFDKEKKSFVFLFTHADEIKEIPDSVEEARVCLEKEIIRLMAGTMDADVMSVLDFMRRSLQKSVPFVDILHPLKTNFPRLAYFVERKMSLVVKPTLAANCGLTLPSQLKLEGELHASLYRLRAMLQKQNVDLAGVKQMRENFHYFALYIDFGAVRKAVSEFNEVLERHIKTQVMSLHKQIKKGTTLDNDFGSQNVMLLKSAMVQLDGLKDDFSVQRASEEITERLELFRRHAVVEALSSLHGVHRQLRKLKAWGEGFDELSCMYVQACGQIKSLIRTATDDVARFDMSSLESSSDERLTHYVHNLGLLKTLSENFNNLSDHKLGNESSVNVLRNAKKQMTSLLYRWCAEAVISTTRLEKIGLDELEVIASRSHAVETLQEFFEKASICPDMLKLFVDVHDDLESSAATRFTKFCDELKRDCQEFHEGWRVIIEFLDAASNLFDGKRGTRWGQMRYACSSVVENIKSVMKLRSGRIEMMSLSAFEDGMKDGVSHGKALNAFEACVWFDGFLQPEDQFIANCSIQLRRTYQDRSRKVVGEVKNNFSQLIGKERGDPVATLLAIKQSIPELLEVARFAHVVQDVEFTKIECEFLQQLGIYLDRVSQRTSCQLSEWESALQNPDLHEQVTLLTSKLNSILQEIEVIETFDIVGDTERPVRAIRSGIYGTFAKWSESAENIMKSERDYSRKAICLASINALGMFSHTAAHLPDMMQLKQKTRNRISEDALKIEKLVEETSEWDQIDKLLVKIEDATVLDEFTMNEATVRLRPLRSLRSQKEEAVDSLLADLLAAQDFKGIREFVAPMATSKNQVKKQKFNRYQTKIAASLEDRTVEMDGFFRTALSKESTRGMVLVLETLEDAQSELDQHLLKSLKPHIARFKNKVNSKLNSIVNKIEEAAKKSDYVELCINIAIADKFAASTDKFLTSKSKNKFNSARYHHKQAIDSIPRFVDIFFQSSFEDGSALLKALGSLRQGSESHHADVAVLAGIYKNTVKGLVQRLNQLLRSIHDGVTQTHCYDDAIAILRRLDTHFKQGLKYHIGSGDIDFDQNMLLTQWRKEQKERDKLIDFNDKAAGRHLEKYASTLDKLHPDAWGSNLKNTLNSWIHTTMTYDQLLKNLRDQVDQEFAHGKAALSARDHVSLQQCIGNLSLIEQKVGKHVRLASRKSQELGEKSANAFLDSCDQAQRALESERYSQFESLFADIRGFVLQIPSVMAFPPAKKKYCLINQLVFETLNSAILKMEEFLDMCNFSALRSKVEHIRQFGGFVADRYSLFYEEANRCDHVEQDKWLQDIWNLCCNHFSCGRDFSRIKYYAVLGVAPSASKEEMCKAYKEQAKKSHPDKLGRVEGDAGAKFRKVKEAWDELGGSDPISKSTMSKPFDDLLKSVTDRLRDKVRQQLAHQRYDLVEKLLFQLSGVGILDDLVTPKLDSRKTEIDVKDLVRRHVEKVRVEVDTNWSERQYSGLNDSITDLKSMELHFKSYPCIFPSSWNTGIIQRIESEIETLGQKCRCYLVNKKVAKEREDDFRRCFIQMGFVLVELPSFKSFTKSTMCSLLESCLSEDWGYSFLFELGLSLQRGDDDVGENENRVGQVLVSEFSHFKEVMTMVWNQETSQKPVEDTVLDVRGQKRTITQSPGMEPLDIDRAELLDRFSVFDARYKSLLGEYIKAGADLNSLVRKTVMLANKLKPISCTRGWTMDVKREIPSILAGIFALFTVLKSGNSYNRIETAGAADIGDKLLMKPHNVQVLTLLTMLGSCVTSQCTLDSQLMQIRTGEGKSMILGAAATCLGLLGFRVRCVCYSEYLSDRDFSLFEDIFRHFHLLEMVKYSKITRLSEDATAVKGDIRGMTEALLHGAIIPERSSLDAQMMKECHGKSAQGHTVAKSRNQPIPPVDTRSKQDEAVKSAASALRQNKCTSPSGWNIGARASNNKTTEPDAIVGQTDVIESALPANMASSPLAARCQLSPGDMMVSRGSLGHPADTHELGNVYQNTPPEIENHFTAPAEEILLVDEVDVFFGSEFYGQTYNQVAQLKEPEIAEILKAIWEAHKRGGRKHRLADIKTMSAYTQLLLKMPAFDFLLDNELALMLDQVQHVGDPSYFLDTNSDRIGYKVMDTISFEATYGYRTVFAYLKEADDGNLKDKEATLKKMLVMQVSCGQFSYANIAPARILGVSGTLEAMGQSEKDVLSKYGINTFVYVPSVYGKSNFEFDKAGCGICVESNRSDFFHRIFDEIQTATKAKRAVIVFFRNRSSMNEFISSPFFHKLGRKKMLLTENMTAAEKEFVINKAATSGQVTICPAVFGRGTDFFCKDERVQQNGGVHIIQTFLSVERSEEIQIQGRTSRQGKKGSYQMVILESDLEEHFAIPMGEKDKVAKRDLYEWLCNARDKRHTRHWNRVESDLIKATEKDVATHMYFDTLIDGNQEQATMLFKDIYLSMKKRPLPSNINLDLAFLIDVTGSMCPYARTAASTIRGLLEGDNSIVKKLKSKFPDIKFNLRIAVMGYRDIDDQSNRFRESVWKGGSHFTEKLSDAIKFVDKTTADPSGGFDLAEDHLGAIHRCTSWNGLDDWSATIKLIMLFTDAPAHGFVPLACSGVANVDNFPVRHPEGLTTEAVAEKLLSKEIDLFICSFNPSATSPIEEQLAKDYLQHPSNIEEREMSMLPMVSKALHQSGSGQELLGSHGKHIVFVLDESGSMQHYWAGVVVAYQRYMSRRRENQCESDLVSVVQFDSRARITVNRTPLAMAPPALPYAGGGTLFDPAATCALQIVRQSPSSHAPVVVFMSDGESNDAAQAARTFSTLNQEIRNRLENDLELHVIAFGSGADNRQLQCIAGASPQGKVYESADTAELSNIFVNIASDHSNVAAVLESEIGKRISDAVTDKLSLEYMG